MTEEIAEMLDQSCLDLSIVQIDLGPEKFVPHQRPSSGFWRASYADGDMAVGVRHLVDIHIDKPISRDMSGFCDRIFELHKMDLESIAEPENIERPNEVDDQVVECTPQFILRNIPKIERYYDLDRVLPFEVTDMPKMEADDLLADAKKVHLGDIEFIEVESVNFINDFRSFLEEIFYLCPWDQITRQEPDEDSPWHIKNSTTKLAQDLLSRKNTLFIFSAKGMTQMGMKAYKPREEKNEPTEARPDFVRSYGPG
ncbi:MAG: hypothetical protein IJ165_13005 [Proteobacteria bacterium]|nr:hypothetical protein [Pseudomonadota bacterium]